MWIINFKFMQTKLKKNILNISLFLMLLISALCFFGCSEISGVTRVNTDGSIEEFVLITLKEEEINAQGYSIDEIKEDVERIAMREALIVVENFRSRIFEEMANAAQTEQFKLQEYINGIEIIGSNGWNDNSFIIGIKFNDVNVYRYYYELKDNSVVMNEEKHFLYNKISYTASNMFAEHNEIYERVYNELSATYPDFTNEDNEVTYTYVADTRREHSNADSVVRQDNKYYHIWSVNPDEINDNIVFYFNIANRSNCILMCIGISVFVSIILVIVGVIVDKRKNKKESEIENKN